MQLYSYISKTIFVVGHVKKFEKAQQDVTMGKQTSALDTSTSHTRNVVNRKLLQLFTIHFKIKSTFLTGDADIST